MLLLFELKYFIQKNYKICNNEYIIFLLKMTFYANLVINNLSSFILI